MLIKFDDAFAAFHLWLEANPAAAADLPSKSLATDRPGQNFVRKYAKEWTNEMLFAYLLVAGCADAGGYCCDRLRDAATVKQQEWLNGGDRTRRWSAWGDWGDCDFANSFAEMKDSAMPYMLVHTNTLTPRGDAYVTLAKITGMAYHDYGIMTPGVPERVTARSEKQFVWKSLNSETTYYGRRKGSLGDHFAQFMAKCYAKLYRTSLKAKPKKEKPALVTRAIAFHNDQVKLLAVADELAVKLRAFQRDVEAGNLNKTVVAELYSQFEELQRNTTETKKTHKRFVGEIAEETRKLAEEGLASTK